MSGDWRIRVYRVSGSVDEYYDLEMWLSSADDWMEDNDDFYSAWYINPNYYSGLMILGGDDDWFSTYLEPGDIINVEIYFNHMDGDLQLELYDPDYYYRDGSFSSSNDEYIYFEADMYGDWRIHVYHEYGDTDVNYDLDLTLSIEGDYMEENDDFYSAYPITPDYYSNLKILGSDNDWYRIHLNDGDMINILINFDNMEGNLQLELFDPSYSWREGSYSSYDYYEEIHYEADVTGDWRIRVYHAYADSDVDYSMDVWLEFETSGDDWMEENDGFYMAWYIDPDWHSGLRLMGEDEDWFKTYVNAGDVIDVSIFFQHEEGDLQLEIYDPSYTKRASSYSSTETYDHEKEHAKVKAQVSGDWRIRVFHKDGDSNVYYDLDLWILDDWYEFNNNEWEAYYLTDYEKKWLSDIGGLAAQNDEDWYEIEVTPGFQHLVVNFKFNKSLGNINVDLHRWYDYGYRDHIGSNYSMSGDNEIDLEYYYIDPGVYLLQVSGDYTGLEYNMWYDDKRTEDLLDDNYEENDDPTTAYDLSYHEHDELWDIDGFAEQFDNDWYKIRIDSTRTHLIVKVMYDYQEGAIGIGIYNWNFAELVSNFTQADDEIINYDLPSNGTYYIRIFGDTSGNIYNLIWKAREPYVDESIPGYDIFFLLSAIFGVAIAITIKWKRSKRNI